MGRVKERAMEQEPALSVKSFPALNGQGLINNLTAGETLSFGDLTKVTVPTGGLKLWAVDTAEGQATTETMTGIILVQTLCRFLYAKPFEETGGTEAPLCFSTDSVKGFYSPGTGELPEHLAKIGVPSGQCLRCVFSQYGTRAKGNGNGRGQACQQKRLLMMLTQDSRMPQVVSIPPSGLKAAKKYLVDLQAMGLEYWQVLTEISLIGAKNQDNINYARPKFRMVEILPQTMIKPVNAYRSELEQQMPVNTVAANYPALPDHSHPQQSVN